VSNRFPNAGRLVLAMAAMWLVMAGPAVLLQGPLGVEGLTWAAGICLLPGLLVVTQIGRLGEDRPLAGMVVAVGLRLLAAVVAAFVLCLVRPDLRGEAFIVWLVPCYLAALAVETQLLLDGTAGLKPVSTAACRS
jgi:hypothetical protein